MINQFLIVPRFGRTPTGYDMGEVFGKYCQLDVINHYTRAFCEQLDRAGIRFETIGNSGPYSQRERDRIPILPVKTMAIICGLGFSRSKKAKRNYSSAVAYGFKNRRYARFFLDGMNDWGKQYNFEHGSTNPKFDKDNPYIKDYPEQIPILEIRPFQLGAANYEEYLVRLESLGVTLANCVKEIIVADLTR